MLSQETRTLPERSPLGGERLRALVTLAPIRLPGWSIVMLGSHSRPRIVSWLLAKGVFQRLSDVEKSLLVYITLDFTNFHSLVDILVKESARKKEVRRLGEMLQRTIPVFQDLSERFLFSFKPEAEVSRIWTEPVRLSPARYVGVGYKDHGSLGSAPSWKDQISGDGEESDVNAQVLFLWDLIINGNRHGTSTRERAA